VIGIAMIHVTYEPMEGVFVDVARPYPMDRYTWGVLTASSTRGSTPCTRKICINRCKHVED
jgi:hypothetical protein